MQVFDAKDVVLLLTAALGLPKIKTCQPPSVELGMLAEAYVKQQTNLPIIEFLLPISQSTLEHPRRQEQHVDVTTSAEFSDARFQDLCKEVLNLLDAEVHSTYSIDLFHASSSSSNLRLGDEAFRSITQLGIVALALISSDRVRRMAKVSKLREDVSKLRSLLVNTILEQDDKTAAVNGLLTAFGGLLTYGNMDLASAGAHEMASAFGTGFWQKAIVDEDEAPNDDLLIVEDSLESQSSRGRSETQDTSRSRRQPREPVDTQGFKVNRTVRICLASFTRYRLEGEADDRRIQDGFIEYVTQLKAQDFLRCRSVFLELFRGKASISLDAALSLLEYLGQELLEPDEFERCEDALSMTLEIMAGLAELWIPAEGDLLSAATQLYEWFIKVALPKRVLSPRARVCMANMLRKVLELRPDYTKDLSLESTRTSLFRIFEEGTVKVKYFIGTDISGIFKYFVLSEHDAILEDVLSSLPLEPEWTEGSAIRIYILGRLGASWSTLLRRCIYAIVEASALVPACSEHARKCFERLSRDLGLDHPKNLFKLFASQIIYTWLDTRALSTLPFEILGYKSLKNLLDDVQSEITAQLIMRGRQSEAKELSNHSQKTIESLVKDGFPRSVAYCLARDAAIPPDADTQAANATLRLRGTIGKDQFDPRLRANFPEILSILFLIADREESISKGFQRRDTFSAASHAYDEILSSGASQTALAVSQQPSFKASFLLDEIDYLCGRAGLDTGAFWSPAIYTYIFRELLDSVHPAFGPLHTCSVIRRIRILVSMAGDSALRDYPLEMALHSLRRFLTDAQCSEDVIGLFKYLISHGIDYLQQAPSFLAGFVVSTLVSLRAFLESPRDSTTQESQYIATMSKAREFHGWLGNLITNYSTPALGAFEMETMRRIVNTAVQVRTAGSSRPDMPESELLLMMLEDNHSGRNLIDQSSFGNILDVLCSEFDFSPNFRDDVLGTDTQAVRSAPILLDTVISGKPELNYQRWVARVLGRAYAATGKFSRIDLKEHKIRSAMEGFSVPPSHVTQESRMAILHFLQNMLLTDNLRDIGNAERALRRIVSTATREPALSTCVEQLSQSLLSAFSQDTYTISQNHPPTLALEHVQGLPDALQIEHDISYPAWIKRLSLALAITCPNDPLLSAFIPIIQYSQRASDQLFPQIFHLALITASGKQNVKASFSLAASRWLAEFQLPLRPYMQQLFKAILYLRTQEMPHESTKSDRNHWLDIDFRLAAEVAAKCGLFTTSLLFLEISFSEASRTSSRRSSINRLQLPQDLMLEIYQHLDDKDSFYGIRQPSSLHAMMNQLEFENAGFKSLSFRGAYYDSQIKHSGSADRTSETDIIKLLDAVNLNGVSQALLSNVTDQASIAQEAMFTTARKLERWDITGPSDATNSSTIIFKAFQNIHDSAEYASVTAAISHGFQSALGFIVSDLDSARSIRYNIGTLAVLSEIEDVISSQGIEQLIEAHSRLREREAWMLLHRFGSPSRLSYPPN